MPGDLTIRFVTRQDYAQWLPLWDGYNAFYGRPELPDSITRTLWRRLFDPAEPVHALVAELDGRVVGLAHYLYHLSTSAIEPNCYLQDLFTVPDARGRGAGRALIEAVAEQAKAAGASRVYWLTQSSNAQARTLYDKVADNLGFIQYRKVL